jgi:Acetyltransferase (GNAT) domain
MGEVQSFTEEHADGVATLYFRNIRGRSQPPSKNLAKYFSELYLSNPWASPDIPALVYLEKGKVVGSYGVVPRTMEFRGRSIRIATLMVFMVDAEHRHGPAAIQLLGRALNGPQEFSWTDGASGSVSAFWSALGGYSASLYAFNWIRILRPFGMARSGLDRIGGIGRMVKPLSGLISVPCDLLLSTAPLAFLRKPISPYHSKLVTAGELLECVKELGWREALRPSYSLETFSWLMIEAAKSRQGDLRMVTVSDAERVRCGWFIYYALRDGASFVLQIGVRRKDDFKNTLLALFQDAWQQGSVCVKGAAIPQYLTTMTEQHCIFRHPDDRVLIHSRNPEIANAVRRGEAAITRLDGIGWLRFSRENWDQ